MRIFNLPLLFLLCAVPITPQEKPIAPPLQPNNFSFAGSWDCLGAMGANKPHHSTYEGRMILANTWIELTERDLQPATGYLARYLIGYDPHRKLFLEFDANNFGAALYTSAAGWSDGKLTMTSAHLAGTSSSPARDRFVFQVNGANTFDVDWQTSSSENAPWSLRDHLACTRTSSAAP